MSLRAPIFILGAHKSGTSLLRSLLDGHPDLFVVPIELHFFAMTGAGVMYPLRRNLPRAQTAAETAAAFEAEIAFANRNADPFADSTMGGRIDERVFATALAAAPLDPPAAAFAGVVGALHVALFGKPLPPELRVVEKSVDHAEHAAALRRMFPDARFVHVVRNPYAALTAIRVAKTVDGRFPALTDAVGSLAYDARCLARHAVTDGAYQVVRYEDLVTDTEPTMRRLAGALELTWTPALLRPTLLGEPWTGNSTGGAPFAGISRAPLSAFRSRITALEIALTNAHLGHVLEAHGYERIEPARSSSPWRRQAGEGAAVYARNRALLARGEAA